jgi:hypothetical protein
MRYPNSYLLVVDAVCESSREAFLNSLTQNASSGTCGASKQQLRGIDLRSQRNPPRNP